MPSLLIVAGYFPPSRLIGARRPVRMADDLARRGWDVVVLAPRPLYLAGLDDHCEVPPGIEVIRTHAIMPRTASRNICRTIRPRRAREGTTSTGVSHRHPSKPPPALVATDSPGRSRLTVRRFVKALLRQLEFPDHHMGWIPFGVHAIRKRRFDLVLATMPPYSTALIARRIARRTDARLVLDYRDPWTDMPAKDIPWGESLHQRHRRVEDACLRDAALVVGVTPTLCRWLERRTSAPVVLAPTGTVAAGGAGVLEADKPRVLVYAGSLAYGRSLEPLFSAIAVLAEDFGPEKLRLVYAGIHGAEARRQAAVHGVPEYLEDLGDLAAMEARDLLHRASCAVVIVSGGCEYAYPGKIFDILDARRPILLIAPDGCDAALLVHEHNLGWSHAATDVNGLALSLRELLSGRVPVPRDLESLYTDRIMATLDRTLRRVLEH